MTAQGYDMDQSLATKFQALLGATTRQHHPAAPTNYAPSRVYTEEQFQDMSMVELRNVLRTLGLSNLGPLPKWQLIAHALEKQQQQQQQQQRYHMFTESELRNKLFSELEEIAQLLDIQDVSEYLHAELVQLILATQLSLNDVPAASTRTQATTSTTTNTTNTYSSIDTSLLASAPPAPLSDSPPKSQPVKRSEAAGFSECGLCCFPMGGAATRKMATPPCGHLYCYGCWMEVINKNGRCPQCCKPVSARDITKIYV